MTNAFVAAMAAASAALVGTVAANDTSLGGRDRRREGVRVARRAGDDEMAPERKWLRHLWPSV